MQHWRTISLPSNGLSYSDIVEIKELDFNYMLSADAPFVTSSETDLMYYTIRNYSNVASPEKIYLGDAIYMYNVIHGLSNKSAEKTEKHICISCKKEHTFNINLGNLNVKKLNKKSPELLSFVLKCKNSNHLIKYRRRTLGDNIRSGNNIFEIEDDTKLILKIISYFQDQFISIEIENEESNLIEDLEYVLSTCGLDVLVEFLNKIKKEDFGFESIFKYNCSNCKQENIFDIFDPFSSCLIVSNILSQDERAISKITDILILRTYRILTLEELLNIPISDFDFWNKKIMEVKNIANGKLDYFSNNNQLENFLKEAEVG